jgi:hypothetical protein
MCVYIVYKATPYIFARMTANERENYKENMLPKRNNCDDDDEKNTLI